MTMSATKLLAAIFASMRDELPDELQREAADLLGEPLETNKTFWPHKLPEGPWLVSGRAPDDYHGDPDIEAGSVVLVCGVKEETPGVMMGGGGPNHVLWRMAQSGRNAVAEVVSVCALPPAGLRWATLRFPRHSVMGRLGQQFGVLDYDGWPVRDLVLLRRYER